MMQLNDGMGNNANDTGLQVSVVPDEDASIFNFNNQTYNYLIDTTHIDSSNGNGHGSNSADNAIGNGPSSGHQYHPTDTDPFTIPTSILPAPIPMSGLMPMNQWAPPCGEMEMEMVVNGSLGQQLPPIQYEYGMAYTGLSPAPMMAEGNTTPSNSSMDDLAHSFHAPVQPQYQPHYYNPLPMPVASHSNNPSLASLSSILTSAPPELNVFSSPTTGDEGSLYSLSRQSSMASLTSLYNANVPQAELNSLQNYNTPGKMGRVRSSSRVAPYSGATVRHAHGRSASISSVVSTGPSQQYWSSPSNQIEKSFTNMSLGGNRPQRTSLHHRRTSSKNSGNYPSISSSSNHTHTKSLSSPRSSQRMRQSASMSTIPFGGRSDPLSDIFIPQNVSITDRSAYVQQQLSARAATINNIQNASHQDKARSHWVHQWLRLCYTIGPKDMSVPRQGLFASYEQSCLEYGVKSINAASFGKAVRKAYPKIVTRRLGKRGDSKYHYIRLGPAVTIEARRLNEYDSSRGMFFEAADERAFRFHSTQGPASEMDHDQYHDHDHDQDRDHDHDHDHEDSEHDDEELDEDEDAFPPMKRSPSEWALDGSFRSQSTATAKANAIMTDSSLYNFSESSNTYTLSRPSAIRRHTTSAVPLTSTHTHQTTSSQNLITLPGFPTAHMVSFAMGDVRNGDQMWDGFCRYLQSLVDGADRHDFTSIEDNSRRYWSSLDTNTSSIWQRPMVSILITKALAVCFDHISESLVVTITRGSGLTPNSRNDLFNLAQSVYETLEGCWEAFGSEFKEFKEFNLNLVSRFAHNLRRIGSLTQLNATLCSILANSTDVEQMNLACVSLDAQSIADQCILMTPSIPEDGIHNFLEGLEEELNQNQSTHRMTQWLNELIKEHNQEGVSVLAGSVYTITSEIVRELSLPSHPSLHHFHILKLWIDEYVGIVAGRHAMLSMANKLQMESPSIPEYSPLMIQVPSGNQDRLGSNQATAVPLPPHPAPAPAPTSQTAQLNLGTNVEMDLSSYGSIDYSTITNLGTPFNLQPANTPRQSSSMRECVEPKTKTAFSFQ